MDIAIFFNLNNFGQTTLKYDETEGIRYSINMALVATVPP